MTILQILGGLRIQEYGSHDLQGWSDNVAMTRLLSSVHIFIIYLLDVDYTIVSTWNRYNMAVGLSNDHYNKQ